MAIIKNVNSKSCSPKLICISKLFIGKIQMIFVIYIFESAMLVYFEDLALCLSTKHYEFQRTMSNFGQKI